MDNIINVNNNNENLKFKNGKIKIVNIMHIKPYCQDLTIHLFEDASCSSERAPCFSQDISRLSQDIAQERPHSPLWQFIQSQMQAQIALESFLRKIMIHTITKIAMAVLTDFHMPQIQKIYFKI
jgi:hypothetical protein